MGKDRLKGEFEIDQLDLDNEFARLPGRLARANELYATALKKALLGKANRDRAYAAAYIRLRDEAEEEGEKLTEATLKAQIEADDEYRDAVDEWVVAEGEKAQAWGVCEAIRAKKDGLVNIGANMRAEMSGDPSLREARRGRRDVEDSKSDDEDA